MTRGIDSFYRTIAGPVHIGEVPSNHLISFVLLLSGITDIDTWLPWQTSYEQGKSPDG